MTRSSTAAIPPSISVSPKKNLHWLTVAPQQDAGIPDAFRRGVGDGLLALDCVQLAHFDQAPVVYWRDFARLYLTRVRTQASLEAVTLTDDDCATLLSDLPAMFGAEYVDVDCLKTLWQAMAAALQAQITASNLTLEQYFEQQHAQIQILGKVCFHLAENKRNPDYPFAFLATYAHRLSETGTVKHLPLGRALHDYQDQTTVLLDLLEPIERAANDSPTLRRMVDDQSIFQPQTWNTRQAYGFLKDVAHFEAQGIAVKTPDWWSKRSRPQMQVLIGETRPSSVGFGALLDVDAGLWLDDEAINAHDIQDLLTQSDNLVFFKGKWVEVNHDKLKTMLGHWQQLQAHVRDGVSFGDAMRLMSGMNVGDPDSVTVDSVTRTISGKWLQQTLRDLRTPQADTQMNTALSTHLQATLRPYQQKGVAWLYMLHRLQLGAILADDMGLGKTLQVIALLVLLQQQAPAHSSALLVVPASLLGNWQAELTRFAPQLGYYLAHPSGNGLDAPTTPQNIVITTYGMVPRLTWLTERTWDLIIIDEAQAIKNPTTKQTLAVKKLRGTHRLALTGTPVENKLSDLWSLFDFVSPGLLGSAKQFESFMKHTDAQGHAPYAALRHLTQPYILRRLKTDKSIISDLPDKTELKAYCSLTKAQAALYTQAVRKMAEEIENTDSIQRKGLILSYLMRFKQICNHPAQWLKDKDFAASKSGKFARLHELAEVIAAKQEKMLVFTQFQEMTEPLAAFLATIFNREGLVLHGATPVGKRQGMVKEFQADDGPPFFVLSLKAGGTGLNLTAASHVVHFDRWWNPAMENQATDRAFRIGQKRNVLVHKFICKGTLEEKIDAMLEDKRALSEAVIDDSGGVNLTELSNKELLAMVALDINAATV